MKTPEARITELETQLAHLQRQYDLLNEVVTEQAVWRDQTQKRIKQWEETIEQLKPQRESMGDPLDEKPPHY